MLEGLMLAAEVRTRKECGHIGQRGHRKGMVVLRRVKSRRIRLPHG